MPIIFNTNEIDMKPGTLNQLSATQPYFFHQYGPRKQNTGSVKIGNKRRAWYNQPIIEWIRKNWLPNSRACDNVTTISAKVVTIQGDLDCLLFHCCNGSVQVQEKFNDPVNIMNNQVLLMRGESYMHYTKINCPFRLTGIPHFAR